MSNKGTTMQSEATLGGIAGCGGIAGWVLARFRGGKKNAPRLELLERISLGPRQSLALIEAEGRRLLVATSPEGGPAFYALEDIARTRGSRTARAAAAASARVSW